MDNKKFLMQRPSLPQAKPYIAELKAYEQGKSSAKGMAQDRIIKLSSNENPLGPSPQAIEAYRSLDTLERYPDGSMIELRKAIAQTHGLNPENIVCGAGSDELINLLVLAYAGKGDDVVYSQHGFLMYKLYTQSHGATPVAAEEKNLTTHVDSILAKVTNRTKIIFVANPNNPTGTYLPISQIEYLRDALPGDVLLVLDAAYAEYVDKIDYEAGADLVTRTQNTVMLRTFSKAYGLPALRLGWAYAPQNVVDILQRVRSPFNVSTTAMQAGIAAVNDQAYLRHCIACNAEQREILSASFLALGLNITPSVANFLLVHFPLDTGKTSAEAFDFLMNRGIIVRHVASYGLPHCLRFTIGTAEENRLVIQALQAFLSAGAKSNT